MSSRLNEILGVLGSIASSGTGQSSLIEIRRRRLFAVKEVAKQFDITHETVSDACTRQLKPHVNGIEEFDRLVLEWLSSRSRNLQAVLQHHAVDRDDATRIDHFFSAHASRL
jgi:hypothetical protein